MKTFMVALVLSVTSAVFAQDVTIKDFNNWQLTDVASKGHKKEVLFSKMNRDMIKMTQSICANRALLWAYDFKRFQNVDAGKIFLFYTKEKTNFGEPTWWYHVAPVINEKGSVWVMDAGFAGTINGPMTTKDWLKRFTGSTNCKEIQGNETDLIERMFDGYVFPKTTEYGTYDCYYKYTPGGYWTPRAVAQGLLGKDEDGQPISYVRDEIDTDELMYACVEAVTTPMGRVLGGGKKKCEKYLGLSN